MSLLDIRHAKEALAWRLKEWGVDDHVTLAASFIDDLVAKGWQMDPQREQRQHPPTRADECPRHAGQWADRCGGCAADGRVADARDREPSPFAADVTRDATLARAQLALARSRTCGCGIRAELCGVHRTPTEPTTEETPDVAM